jgi:hypothetical protein
MQQRWTELLMIFATAGLIPLEVRNVWHHPGFDSRAKAAWSDKLQRLRIPSDFSGIDASGQKQLRRLSELRPGSALRYVVVRNEFLPVFPMRSVPNLSNSR